MITQEEAQKKANELFKEKKPFAVVYGYHIKRGINSKEVHEYLNRPIVCRTREDLNNLVKTYLSKSSATRKNPSRITGLDVLYNALDERFSKRTLRAIR